MMIFQYHFVMIALLVCLILTGIHTYLGYHVVKRGVIFVDLALAQVAWSPLRQKCGRRR